MRLLRGGHPDAAFATYQRLLVAAGELEELEDDTMVRPPGAAGACRLSIYLCALTLATLMGLVPPNFVTCHMSWQT